MKMFPKARISKFGFQLVPGFFRHSSKLKMRILYILVILFLRSCSTAPSPDWNFEILVKPVIIMKTEESVVRLFNINTADIPPKDIDSSVSGEESNRVKRQAEETTSAIPDTTAMPTEAAPPSEEAATSNVAPPDGEATPAVPPAESATTSAVPPAESATTSAVPPAESATTSAVPSTESAATSASPPSEVPVTAAAPSPEAVDTAEAVTEPAQANPSADPAQSPGENMEIPNKIVETATMIPVTTIQKAAMDSPVVSQNADAVQKVVSQAPAIAPVVSQNADAVQKAVSEAPAIAQNVETSGGYGFAMPDLSSLGSALGKLAESGQQIASDVKNAVTDMIGQLSNGISGLVG